MLIAEWFRPEQRTEGFASGGPPDVAMMVTAEDLRASFTQGTILRCDALEVILEEGVHHGSAATVRLLFQRA